jgi:hypothetical protein
VRRVHSIRVSSQQRLHLTALLIAALLGFTAIAANAADGKISFSPSITQSEFRKFSRVIAQGIFASPVQPARSSGILSFDIGVAANLVNVDQNAAYFSHSVSNSIATHGYVGVPRLVVMKGIGSGTISATYAKVSKSGIATYGGAIDVPLIRGSVAIPELGLRASYATLSGTNVYKLRTYGVETFISKGIGPFTPYAAVGRMRIDARGSVLATAITPEFTLTDRSSFNRYTVGVRFSLFLPKISIEATQAEVRSYAAKVSFGF